MHFCHVLRSTARPKTVVSVFRRCATRAANQAPPADWTRDPDKTHHKRHQNAGTQVLPYELHLERVQGLFHEVMRRMPHPAVVITALDIPKIVTSPESKKVYAQVPSHWSDLDVSTTTNITSRSSQKTQDAEELAPIARAMTASSFTSLVMKPEPIVLFSCSLPSRTYAAIRNSGYFNVHILSADEQGARIADTFARPQHYQESPSGECTHTRDLARARLGPLAELGKFGIIITDPKVWHQDWADHLYKLKTASEDDRSQKWGMPPPVLHGPGVVYRLSCRLLSPQIDDLSPSDGSTTEQRFALVMGTVTFVEAREQTESQLSRNTLSYVNGAYRGDSEVVLQHKGAEPTKSNSNSDCGIRTIQNQRR